MTEPRAIAEAVEEVVPGVWRWSVRDERIGGAESDGHAVRDGDEVVLIDPLPLAPAALRALGPVRAICLTATCHQRSAWRYRCELGVPVYAPQGSPPTQEEPDARYGAGDLLPGGLRAIHAPGPEDPHYAFLLEREPGVLFCPDLVMREPGGPLEFVPADYHEDPAETRRSVERLLELPFSVLCLDHGAPILDDPNAAMRELLSR